MVGPAIISSVAVVCIVALPVDMDSLVVDVLVLSSDVVLLVLVLRTTMSSWVDVVRVGRPPLSIKIFVAISRR